MKKIQLAIAALMISATANLAYAENLSGKNMDFINLAQECAPLVAPQTMAAIVKTESQFQPLAIGINNRAQLAHQPNSKEEAITTAPSRALASTSGRRRNRERRSGNERAMACARNGHSCRG